MATTTEVELPPPPMETVERWLTGDWFGNDGAAFTYRFQAGKRLEIDHYDGTVVREPITRFIDRIILQPGPDHHRPFFRGRYRIVELHGPRLPAAIARELPPASRAGASPHRLVIEIIGDADAANRSGIVQARLEIQPTFYTDPDEGRRATTPHDTFLVGWLSGVAYEGDRRHPPKPMEPPQPPKLERYQAIVK